MSVILTSMKAPNLSCHEWRQPLT
ncbi:protein of unknown function [Cyanobium sp. NIES-981]|nr:protein of unknown function [Cyanobium sp. NIES-981]